MSPIILQQLQFVSDAGNKSFIVYILSFSTIVYLYFHDYKKEALLLIIASISSFFATILKHVFKQPRPVTAFDNYSFDQYGFPSGHTLLYTALFGFILYLAYKLTGIPIALRIVTVIVSVYFISLVGFSRVYLGQHYVIDVIGGYLFGLLYLSALILLHKRL